MANIFILAKKLQKKNPRLTWQQAIKAAARENKSAAKKSAGKATKKAAEKYRQTGKSNPDFDERHKALPPGPRIPRGGTHVTYYERRKNRSDAPGTLLGASVGSLTTAIKKKLEAAENVLVVKKYRATTKRDKLKLAKQLATIKRELKKFK